MDVDLEENQREYIYGDVVKVKFDDDDIIIVGEIRKRKPYDGTYLFHYHSKENDKPIEEWIKPTNIIKCGPFDDEDYGVWLAGDTVRIRSYDSFKRFFGKIWGLDQGVYTIHFSNRQNGTSCGTATFPLKKLLDGTRIYRCELERYELFKPGEVVEFNYSSEIHERHSGEIIQRGRKNKNRYRIHCHLYYNDHNRKRMEKKVEIDLIGIPSADSICGYKTGDKVHFQYDGEQYFGTIWCTYLDRQGDRMFDIHFRDGDRCRFFQKIPRRDILSN